MKNIVVAGLINIETTVAIDGFPIEYSPIDYRFFGVETTVSGVGYNLAKALKTLGDNVDVLSLIGDDIHKSAIKNEFQSAGINTDYLKTDLADTPQSVILYDKDGRRKILVKRALVDSELTITFTYEYASNCCFASSECINYFH